MDSKSLIQSSWEQRLIKATESKLFFGWLVVTGSFLLTSSYGVFYTLTVFFDTIQKEFHWSSALISSIHSIHLLTFIPAGLIMSWLSEKYNPRLLFAASSAVVGTSIGFLSQIHTVNQFYVLYMIATLGSGAMWAPPVAIAQRWFIKKRGLALGILSAGVGAGGLIHAPLANYLISSFGWRGAYVFEGIITFLVLAIGSIPMISSPEKIGLKPYGADEIENEKTVGNENDIPSWTLKEAIKTPPIIIISLAYLFTVLPIHMLAVHFVPFALGVGIPKTSASAAWGLLNGVSTTGRIIMGNFGQRMGWKHALILCCSMCAISTFWYTGITSPIMLYLFAIIYGFFYGGKVPQLLGLMGFCYGTKSLAPLIAFAHSLSLVGAAAGPVLAGYIHDTTHSYFLAFTISGISWIMAAMLTFFVTRPKAKYLFPGREGLGGSA